MQANLPGTGRFAIASMAAWWIKARSRWLGDPGFQKWALRFPLTRPIARRRAQGLFDLVTGFVHSQVVLACVRLDLLQKLSRGPRPAAAIAKELQLGETAALCLLRAAAAIGLLEEIEAQHFGLGRHGAALLANPGVTAMILHHDMLYADLSDPVALLRRGGGGGRLAAFWPYASTAAPTASPGDADAYSALMALSQPLVAEQIVARYRFARHRSLLDIGGGEGTFLAHVAAAGMHPELALIDLPGVAARARLRLSEQGLADRVSVHSGDFTSDPLPSGADVMSLVRILHDHDDGAAQALLCKIAAALPPGGRLIIAEPFAGTCGSETVGGYFAFYLFAMGSGRPRTPAEIGAMLRNAGFRGWRQLPTDMPLATGLIVARR